MGCSAAPGTEKATPRMDASPDRPANDESSNMPPSDGAGHPLPPDVPAGPPPEPPPRRRVSFLGIAVAGIGVVLAVLGVASLLLSRDNGVSELDARLAGVELDLRDLASRAPPPAADPQALDAVVGRVAKLEAAGAMPPQGASDPALTARIAALETELKALAETVGVLGRHNDEALAAAREARVRADAGAAEISELTQKPPASVDRGDFEALANRVATVERSEKAAESAAKSADRALRLALAATALNAAVERGDAFAAELTAVNALGADPKMTAALEPFARSGVPTSAALARQFSELAPALQQAAEPPPREGVLGRLQLNAEKLVRIRRVDEAAGTDAAAIVARSEATAARGDLAGAASEVGELPPNARAPAEAWLKSVQARTAAIDASRRLAADALAGLSK
jgi:hypothetical protein